MNREIKFRAWDSDHFVYMGLKGAGWSFSESFEETAHAVQWLQYTGLKDKNGVEIYEGDIVIDSRDKTKLHQEVRWYRGGFMLHKSGHFGFSDIERHDGDCKHFEVIGNIMENPDLLERGK